MALIRVSAYAKINFFLAVGDLRPDGFHDIKTVMRRASLCDEVTVETVADGGGAITLDVVGDGKTPTDASNLAYKAAEEYLKKAGISDSVKITLEKNIPVGSGLGGGSADAAATLRALERIYGALEGGILEIAAELGSDVPFCLFGWTAICEGRGEIINPIPDKREMHLVVAMKDRAVSTPDAFRRLDKARAGQAEDASRHQDCLSGLLKYLSVEGDLPTALYNSFEFSLGDIEEDVLDLKRKMKEYGALLTLMSGSGPSVFGIFPDVDSAERCESELRAEGIRAYYSK